MNMSNLNIDYQNPVFLIGAVVVLLAIVTIVAIVIDRRKKATLSLRNRFGSEYDYALREHKTRDRAEGELRERLRRAEKLNIRELTSTERTRLAAEWNTIQSRFIDHPRGAVAEADELVNSVLQACGFPASDFSRRAADLSVRYARLVDPYRMAHEISARAAANQATTEELRTAMIQYRALLDELLLTEAPIIHRDVA